MIALQTPVARLADCRSVAEVGGIGVDMVRTFGCHGGAVLLMDGSLNVTQQTLLGFRDADVEDYNRDWRSADRVLAEVLGRAAPVHNWQVYRPEAHPPMWHHYGRRHDAYHYLVAPLFGPRGSLLGVMSMCRRQRLAPFAATDLRLASMFSGFLSATFARLMTEQALPHASDVAGAALTPREWQVARLAAGGQNNVQIALQLGIARETVKQTLRRVFRKLDANGRAQMAARLALRGLL